MKLFASPLDNRVSAFGDILAIPHRGMFMGNRGCLHDDEGKIRRSWKERRWIICELSYKDHQVPLRSPGLYTPLFFESEASALAAGHRPCALCRRDAYRRFKRKVEKARGLNPGSLTAVELDGILHKDRMLPRRQRQQVAEPDLPHLPSGTVIAQGKRAFWVQEGRLREFSWPSSQSTEAEPGKFVILTPAITVKALALGYRPAES